MEREGLTRAELARKIRVSRARVTQILNLLKLPDNQIEKIKSLGNGLERRVITEHKLRQIIKNKTTKKQKTA